MKATDPAVIWATGFGVGFAKRAPGTVGSVAALAVWWWLIAPLTIWMQCAIIVAYAAVSMVLVQQVVTRYAVKDAPEIVADEVLGMWIALLAAPPVWWVALAGFALFRLFDIWKPGPVGWLDKNLPGAWGVMLDDVVAGVLSLGVLQLSLLVV